MANASTKTLDGKRVMLHRSFTLSPSTTQYLPPSKLYIGMNNSTAAYTATDLDYPIPIQNGTICDTGANTLTGALGGTTSTDNTTTYKEAANTTDAKAQNLITTGSNVTKQWYKTSLTNNVVAATYVGFWLYIKDATTLAKFLTAGTALEARFGSDASNYYKITKTAANLATGWNFITSNKTLVSALTATGTPGTLSRFDIIITTNNAADAFVAGDVVYDVLRTWVVADLEQAYDTSFPTLDYTTLEATTRVTITSALMNGFAFNAIGFKNADTTKLLTDIHTITTDSKDSTDMFVIEQLDRVI
jgi:hypothetical protein